VLVSNIQIVTTGAHAELRAEVRSAALGQPFLLWYRVPSAHRALLNPGRGDPFIPALLLAAMRAAEPLEVRAPVSPTLLGATDRLQAVYRAWDPTLALTTVAAPTAEPDQPAAAGRPGVGLFFSLGVDSFFSLLRNVGDHPDDEQTIDHLVVVRGFDYPVDRGDESVFSRILANAGRVAATLGDKTVIPVATNIRHLMDRFANWSLFNHGAGMASVGLALGGGFRRLHVAAGPTYASPSAPCGSHPLLDPLWSTEDLTFVYDGAELWRASKLRFIADFPIALEKLRVCPKRRLRQYNCARCHKCLRTMMILDAAGALGRCRTLPRTVRPSWLEQAKVPTTEELAFSREVVRWLRSSERHPHLLDAYEERLDRCIARRFGRLDRLERDRLRQARHEEELVALRAEAAALGARNAALDAELRQLREHDAALRGTLARQRARSRRATAAGLGRLDAGRRRLQAGAGRLLVLSLAKLGLPTSRP
jgi:hypothetical protein